MKKLCLFSILCIGTLIFSAQADAQWQKVARISQNPGVQDVANCSFRLSVDGKYHMNEIFHYTRGGLQILTFTASTFVVTNLAQAYVLNAEDYQTYLSGKPTDEERILIYNWPTLSQSYLIYEATLSSFIEPTNTLPLNADKIWLEKSCGPPPAPLASPAR